MINFSKNALNDLENMVDLHSSSGKESAIKSYHSIREKLYELTDFSEKGRIIPEMEEDSITAYRELLIGNLRVSYRIEKEIIFIIRILNSKNLI